MATTFNVISLGNLADMDTVEGDDVAENASALVGLTLGGVGDALVDDFVTFSPGTGSYGSGAASYFDQDNSPGENFRIDGGPDQLFDSAARFNVTITYIDGTTATANVAIFQDVLGNTYLAPEISQNASQDALEAAPIRSITLDSLDFNTTHGLYAQRDGFEFVACYAPGTIIETPSGPQRVEFLRAGDRVLTKDHGPQKIRWTHCSDHSLESVSDRAKPVLIRAGALGENQPAQDLVVSPQHRILVGEAGQLSRFFAHSGLAQAKSLTAVPGIRHMLGKARMTWVHFACDRHEIVKANGCYAESLLLGPMVLQGLSRAERKVLTDIYGPVPASNDALNGAPARECLTVKAAQHRILRDRLQRKPFPRRKAKAVAPASRFLQPARLPAQDAYAPFIGPAV